MNILITGSNGFVGNALYKRILDEGHHITTLDRCKIRKVNSEQTRQYEVGDFANVVDWKPYLKDIDIIYHLAGRAHVMHDNSDNKILEYRLNNTFPTQNLFRDAGQVGVKRFIFMSSIKVNGERTDTNHSFNEDTYETTIDPYGLSKFEAEQSIIRQSQKSKTEFVIIRPPMIYGKGVKGNLVNLIKAVKKGFPLPFGCINNTRSLIGLNNLIDILVISMNHPRALNEIFVVSDFNISIKNLIKKIGYLSNKNSNLIKISPKILKLVFKVIRRDDLVDKLISNLELNNDKVKRYLDWCPAYTIDDELKDCIDSVYKD